MYMLCVCVCVLRRAYVYLVCVRACSRVRMYILCVRARASTCVHVGVCVYRDLGHDEVIIADKEEPWGGGVPQVKIEQRQKKLGQRGPVVGRQDLPCPVCVCISAATHAHTQKHSRTKARVLRTGT